MSGALVLFPNRVAIGTAGGVPVYMSPEFSRALSALLERVGGESGAGLGDVSADLALAPAQSMALLVIELQIQVEALSTQLAALAAQKPPETVEPAPLPAVAQIPELGGSEAVAAQLQALARRVDAAELERVPAAPGVDWGHPGAIGAGTPKPGTFTDLTATGKFGCNGKAAQPAVASGGALAGVIAALVNCGILAS